MCVLVSLPVEVGLVPALPLVQPDLQVVFLCLFGVVLVIVSRHVDVVHMPVFPPVPAL